MAGSYPNSRLACLFCTQNCHRTHGMGQGTGATMLSFVKIMTKCTICCRSPSVYIPSRFRESVGCCHHNKEVILEGPSGEEWAVGVYEHTSRMFLRAGWGRFVEDNRLEMGDVVFFTYIGDARFSLKIYGGDGLEKSFPFSAKNAQARTTYPANKKRLEREWEAEDNASNASQVVERNKETAAETSSSVHESRKLTRQAAKSSTPPKTEAFVDSAPAGKPNADLFSCKTVQLGSPENPIDLDDNTSETDMDSVKASCRPTVKRKLQFGQKHGNASGVPFLRRNMQRQAPLARSKSLLEELGIQAAFRLAMEAASSYVTNCPSFIISLRSFQVTGLDVLDVKRDFAKQFLPSKAANIVLVDMNGRSWPVKWFGIRRSVIAAGWANFVQHHSLKSRDVCLFELTAPRNFQVRIYRVTEFPETLNEAGKQDAKDEVEIIEVDGEEGITVDRDGNVQDKQKNVPVSGVEDEELVNKLMQLMHKPAADMLSVFYKLATNQFNARR